MAHRRDEIPTHDLDGLRLLALGRIPRCGSCPRWLAMVDAHARGAEQRGCLPGAPDHCTHQVCAPLCDRLDKMDGDDMAANGRILQLRAS